MPQCGAVSHLIPQARGTLTAPVSGLVFRFPCVDLDRVAPALQSNALLHPPRCSLRVHRIPPRGMHGASPSGRDDPRGVEHVRPLGADSCGDLSPSRNQVGRARARANPCFQWPPGSSAHGRCCAEAVGCSVERVQNGRKQMFRYRRRGASTPKRCSSFLVARVTGSPGRTPRSVSSEKDRVAWPRPRRRVTYGCSPVSSAIRSCCCCCSR